MSDILIRGMEMPKENDYTIAIVYGDGVVTEYHEDYWIRGADCEKQIGTAVPVPPHGRLIDADELIREHRADNYDYAIYATYLVQNAPSVIPASE